MNVNLAFNIPQLSIDWLTDQYSLVFSNLNASKVPFVFNGKNQIGQFYFVPGTGKVYSGVSVSTTGPYMSMAVQSDKVSMENP